MIAPSRGIVTKNWLGTPVLMRAIATFPGLPLLRVSSDVVRTLIAEATIARQNIASAVAIVERAILAVPIDTFFAVLDHRAPRSRGALRVSWTEASCASSFCNLHVGVSNNNTKEAVAISICRGRLSLP